MPKSPKKINKEYFRIAIFGSARTKRNDPNYKKVHNLAKEIAEEGLDIVTGGGPGLMDAASRGHHRGRKNSKIADPYSIGLTITLPHEQKDAFHLDIKKHFNRFSNRLDTFMDLSNLVIVTSGGIGTLLELMYSWQLLQVGQVQDVPIILLGSEWMGLLKWIKKEMLRKKFISKKDFDFIFIAKNNKEAMKLIKEFYGDFLAKRPLTADFNRFRLHKI